MIREIERRTMSGVAILIGLLALMLLMVGGIVGFPPPGKVACAVALVPIFFFMTGLFMVAPNEARVLQLFGDYVGTAKQPGLRWANPLFTARRISTRVRNFESGKLKVNEHDGSPIEIAAVVVWRVIDTAEAMFEVDDYENFVQVQSEAALRNLATQYPYDSQDEHTMSLRGNAQDIAVKLKEEVQDRLAKAGVEVIEARISHLAYAPEIAGAMLRRQQASAIIAARSRIVEGAVGMVQMALAELERNQVVDFDADRKAAMVSNLLVVLCGEHEAQPVVNAGSIYQ